MYWETIQLRKKMFTEGTVWYNNLLFIFVEIRKIKSTLEVGKSVHTLNYFLFFFENHLPTFKQFIYAVDRGRPQKTSAIWRGCWGLIYTSKKIADMRKGGKKDVKKLEKFAIIFYGWSILENIWRLLLHIPMQGLL